MTATAPTPDSNGSGSGAGALLTRLTGDAADFLERDWGRRTRVTRHSAPPPLTLDDVDALLTSGGLRVPAVRVMHRGAAVPQPDYTTSGVVGGRPVADFVHPGKVTALFRDGATVNLQGVQRLLPAVRAYCDALDAALGHPAQVNAYLSPAHAQGLRVHHDTHDVFVVQVHGRKTFELFEPQVRLPLRDQPWAADEPPGAPAMTVELAPGDCLYLPRGVPHRAFTGDSASLHCTVGVLVVTWHAVLLDAVRRALAADERFRAALPPGWLEEPELAADQAAKLLAEAARLVGDLDPAEVTRHAVRRRVTSRPAPLRGLVRELAEPRPDVRRWRRRAGATAVVAPRGERVALVLADRTLTFPRAVEPALRVVAAAETVTEDALAEHLDAAGRSVLLRVLRDEGLLVPDDGS